jgi:hypothetical protein
MWLDKEAIRLRCRIRLGALRELRSFFLLSHSFWYSWYVLTLRRPVVARTYDDLSLSPVAPLFPLRPLTHGHRRRDYRVTQATSSKTSATTDTALSTDGSIIVRRICPCRHVRDGTNGVDPAAARGPLRRRLYGVLSPREIPPTPPPPADRKDGEQTRSGHMTRACRQ